MYLTRFKINIYVSLIRSYVVWILFMAQKLLKSANWGFLFGYIG